MMTYFRLKSAKLVKRIMKAGFFFLAFLTTFTVGAQQEKTFSWTDLGQNEIILLILIVLAFFISILVLVVALLALRVLKTILLEKEKAAAGLDAKAVMAEQEQISWWRQLKRKMTAIVPIEKEETILLDHDYDGIHELDNHLPPWWTYLFYLTIVFSVVYMLVYFVFDAAPLQEEEYNIELAEAEAKQESRATLAAESIDENSVEITSDENDLSNGETLFMQNCAACHKADGGGGVGPNLTDEYWIHGGGIQNIFKTIKYGVPEKGMIAWQNQLTPSQMRDVSSYIISLEGTDPPGAKEPQGDKYVPEVSEQPEEEQGK